MAEFSLVAYLRDQQGFVPKLDDKRIQLGGECRRLHAKPCLPG